MTKQTPKPAAAAGNWLLCVANLPIDDPAARMRILRTLESLGTAVIREGAYLLPDNPENRQALGRLAEYIGRNGNVAHMLCVKAASPAQDRALRELFDRSSRYNELIKVVDGLKLGYGVSDPGAISRVLHKQRREFEAISALDFFPGEARHRAAGALDDAETAVRALLFPADSRPGFDPDEHFLGRTWATRKPLWADRLACAWLIRRFMDPEATLLWLEKSQPLPAGAIGFAFEGARFANSGSRVTFEEMLVRLDLADDPALPKIGTLVHYLEVRGDPVPEAAGVQTLLQGAMRRADGEDQLLRESEKTFDLLYDAYCDPPPR
ncbi:MAG: chromate resistance protein ChrB domain-containing protein [Burkholderiales bacterium]